MLDVAYVVELGLDPRRVVAGRVVDERHDCEREQGELPIDPEGDDEHTDESKQALEKGRYRDRHAARGLGRVVDRVDERAVRGLVVERLRQLLGVPEKVTA